MGIEKHVTVNTIQTLIVDLCVKYYTFLTFSAERRTNIMFHFGYDICWLLFLFSLKSIMYLRCCICWPSYKKSRRQEREKMIIVLEHFGVYTSLTVITFVIKLHWYITIRREPWKTNPSLLFPFNHLIHTLPFFFLLKMWTTNMCIKTSQIIVF